MNIEIKQSILLENLNYVIRGISTKNIIPILNCIKFELTNEGLYMTSTDNDSAIKTFIPVEKIEKIINLGEIVISGKYIYDIVRKLPNEIIKIEEFIDNKINISTTNSSFDLNCNNVNEFPELDLSDSKTPVHLTRKQFKTIIKQTAFAASTQENRPEFTGINFKIADNKLECTSTDSYRLAKKEIELEEHLTDLINIIVPTKNLVELERMLDDSDKIVIAASCTTNCLAPVLKLVDDNFGIIKGFMTTIHAYTNDQVTLDVSHKKGSHSRRGRACAMNIVPTSTGAATAIGKVIPSREGKLSGGAIRVPVSDGSLVDLSLELEEKTTEDEINSMFLNNESETIKGTFDPIVSSDIISSTYGAVVDLSLTKVLEVDGKQLVKIIAWYDNEMGYSAQMVRTAKKLLGE